MLLRASNAVGYTNYPDNVVREFIRYSAAEGIDVFRIFDSLNWIENLKVAVETVREETSALCEAAICYSGDILDPRRTKFSLKYYVAMARELVKMGTHILGIKDMAGLCKPYAAQALVRALRDEVDVPIHFHTHDASGIAAGSILRAADAGVDIADAALASMSGTTSQPCLNSVIAALANTPRDTGLDPESLNQLSEYWAAVREYYYPFEESMKSPSADIYLHEMPGGQYTNLRQQAISMGLGDRWPEVVRAYAQANQLFGDIVKVTPSSKVVGDMALFMVNNGLAPADILSPDQHLSFPKSVVEMMQGMLGRPDGGWPGKIEKIVLQSAGVQKIRGRAGAKLPKVDLAATKKQLAAKVHHEPGEPDVLSYVLYPQVYLDFDQHLRKFSDTSVLPTPVFFYGLQPGEEVTVEIEPGKALVIQYATTSDLHDDGTRTVYFDLNGQPRAVRVPDHIAEGHVHRHPKADKEDPNHVAAPMPGKVSTVNIKKGDTAVKGQPLLSLEAMKMESAVYAPRDARIADVLVQPGSIIEAGDLLVVLE
jgi:pyruvate carboxylase